MRLDQHSLFQHLEDNFDQVLRQPLHKQPGCKKKLSHDEYQERSCQGHRKRKD